LVTALPRPSLTAGLDTERNLANDVMPTGNLFSIGDIPKQKKMKCEELSVLKTMQAIMRIQCTAVLVKHKSQVVYLHNLNAKSSNVIFSTSTCLIGQGTPKNR